MEMTRRQVLIGFHREEPGRAGVKAASRLLRKRNHAGEPVRESIVVRTV
jgi:hypothetical protein